MSIPSSKSHETDFATRTDDHETNRQKSIHISISRLLRLCLFSGQHYNPDGGKAAKIWEQINSTYHVCGSPIVVVLFSCTQVSLLKNYSPDLTSLNTGIFIPVSLDVQIM